MEYGSRNLGICVCVYLVGPLVHSLKESQDVKSVRVLITKEAGTMPNTAGGTLITQNIHHSTRPCWSHYV